MNYQEKLQQILDEMEKKEQRTNRTTDIISTFAFLIGVKKSIFENPYEAPDLGIFERMGQEKAARIIRNLCIIRTSLEHNFSKINNALRNDYRSITSLTEYIPYSCQAELANDGVSLFKKNSNANAGSYIIEINRIIGDRINNCKQFFPTWLNWNYIKDLFIMPNGLSEEGIKAAANVFFTHLDNYPYGVYLNWSPQECGNLLSSDKKFVILLYEWNEDSFTQLNKVEDAGEYVTDSVYDFIKNGEKILFVVDCENSDPFNLCAALLSIDEDSCSKVEKVVLFDDIHTSSAWIMLEDYIPIPVEHILIERLKENKSMVDMRLALRVSEEFYKNNVDSFIIVSSDSDYWSVNTSIPSAKFLFMVEHGKCGPDMREALEEQDIFYCYIDEFHSVKSERFMADVIHKEMLQYMAKHLCFNFHEMMNNAINATRAPITDAEKKQFFDKYIRPFQASMDSDGNLKITLKINQ